MQTWFATLVAGISTSMLLLPSFAASRNTGSDYCVLSVEEDRGDLAVIDNKGGRVASVTIGKKPHEVEVSKDGKTAYVSQFGIADYDHRIGVPGTKVVEVDLRNATTVGQFVMPSGATGPHGVKLRPHFQELYVNTEVGGDRMFVFDTNTRSVKRSFALPAGTHNFVFSADGGSLFSFAGKGGVSRIEVATGHITQTFDPGAPVRGLAFAKNGDLLASARGEVVVLRSTDLGLKQRLIAPVHGQLLYLQELASGELAAPAMDDNGVVIFAGRSARFVPTGKAPIFVRQASDGRIYVANVDDTYVSVLSALGKPVGRVGGLLTPNGLSFGRCPVQRSH